MARQGSATIATATAGDRTAPRIRGAAAQGALAAPAPSEGRLRRHRGRARPVAQRGAPVFRAGPEIARGTPHRLTLLLPTDGDGGRMRPGSLAAAEAVEGSVIRARARAITAPDALLER